MLYSKNGSIPYDHTDGTDGWIEVEDPPVAPDGKEVVWWFPPGWVIRDPKPEQAIQTFSTYDAEGNVVSSEDKLADWSWSQSQEQWVAYPVLPASPPSPPQPDENTLTLETLDSTASAIAMPSAIETVIDTGTGMGSAMEV